MITDDSRDVGQMDHIDAAYLRWVCAELQYDIAWGLALGVVADELIDVIETVSRGARGDEHRWNRRQGLALPVHCPGRGRGHGEHRATI